MLLSFAYGVILFLIITRGWTTNVSWHIRASRAAACDNLHLRASTYHWHIGSFLCDRKFQEISYYAKKEACPKADLLKFASISPGS